MRNRAQASVEKTNLILKGIQQKLRWENREHDAYSLLRITLHNLRDRLTIEEAADFSAQLPLFLSGVFYDGWKPSKLPIKLKKQEFIDKIRAEIQFDHIEAIETLVQAVLDELSNFISPGEMRDVKSVLPKKFEDFFPPTI